MEQMKADILRRAEEISDDEDEDDIGAGRGKALAFEEELDDQGAVRVRDGEPSDDGEEETDPEGEGGIDVRIPFRATLLCGYTILTT